jgi:chromosome segregation ATPase
MILWFIRGITHTLTAAWYNFIYYSQSLLSYFIPETKVKDDAETARPREQLAKDVNQQEIANKAEQQEAAAIAELQNMSLGLRRVQLKDEEAEREACISALIERNKREGEELRALGIAQQAKLEELRALGTAQQAKLEAQVEAHRAEIAQVGARIEAQGAEIAQVGARIETQGAEIVQVGARIETQGAEIVQVGARIETQGAEIVQVGARIETQGAEIVQLGAQLRTVIRAEIERRSNLTQASSSSLSFNVFLEEDLSSAVIANFAKVAEQHWETINTKSTDITSFTYPTLL